MIFLLIFAGVCAINRCTALDLQQQLMLQSAISYLETQFEDLSNSTKPECKTALLETFQGVRDQQFWALKIVDSIPKIPSGILQGNLRDYGNYEECLSVRNEDAKIQGKYCLVNLELTDKLTNDVVKNLSMQFNSDEVDLSRLDVDSFNKSMSTLLGVHTLLSWGFCVPHACDGEDVTALFDHIVYANFKEPIVRITSRNDFCQVDLPEPLPLKTLVAMIAFGIVFAIAGASTVYDVLVYQKRKLKGRDFWICFSFLTNGRKLFLEQRREDTMSSMNGIRAIACVIIIVSHVRQYNVMSPLINTIAVMHYDRDFSWRSIVITAGPFTIDTFLLISGMLLSYNFLKEAQTHAKTVSGIPAFYLHRIIRLTPSLMAVTIFHWTILKWFVTGPSVIPFKNIEEDSRHWWAPILYVSNYMYKYSNHTWYLAVDMQLFLLSPIFLFALLRKPKLGYALLALAFATSTGYSIYLFYLYRLSTTVADMPTTPAYQFIKLYHLTTEVRMTPWLLGLAYGHFLHTALSKKLLNHATNILGWLSAISTFLYFMSTHHTYSVHQQGMLFMSLYYAFNRPLWALSVAFIIYSCRMGYGGLFNYILSLRVFRILSNLSYSMYLTHIDVLIVVVSTRWTSSYLSDTTILVDLCSTYLVTLIASIPFALCFEYPFVAIEAYFRKRDRPILDHKAASIETLTKDN